MDTVRAASDDVLDAIAHIESHRRESAQGAEYATAGNEALRKLHELLNQEQEAAQRHGPGTRHPANVETIATEISRVKKLTGTPPQGSLAKAPLPGKHHVALHAPIHSPLKSKGRRMGRRGDS